VAPPTPPPPRPDAPLALRKLMISEYCASLRGRTNRKGRPFQDGTISAYRDAVVALDAWMTRTGREADFTGCDTAALNRFFAAYLAEHGQGGAGESWGGVVVWPKAQAFAFLAVAGPGSRWSPVCTA
jgi:hypothetical protein